LHLSGLHPVGYERAESGTLFNPLRHIRLYGIQYAWQPSHRLLKCVPASVVVELLQEHYPDMRDKLTSLFRTVG
jgi:hypothetical protein